MTIVTEAYVDEPIVIVTVEGWIDETQQRVMYHKVLADCSSFGICFIILDTRGANTTVHECLALLLSDQIVAKHRSGEVHITVIGNFLPNESRENILYPVLPDQATALQQVRQQIATHLYSNSQSEEDV